MTRSQHLEATMAWLARAQDGRPGDRGVSAAFRLAQGWLPSYPETTGYIIETFLRYGDARAEPAWARRAEEAGAWLLTKELPGGGFPSGDGAPGRGPRVFNTGMILFGLAALLRRTGDPRYAMAGQRTLAWLCAGQAADGSFAAAAPDHLARTYHSRVAWGMVEMDAACGRPDPAVRDAVLRACAWVLDQRDETGWFNHNELFPGLPPLTHNIAYTLRGLIEVGALLGRDELVAAARTGAEALRRDLAQSGTLAAAYGPGWRRGAHFRCVTGEAQMGLVWKRLDDLVGDPRMRVAAEEVARQVASTQTLADVARYPALAGVIGGVPGPWPLWCRYLRFGYPNWAAKFFADLLMELEPRA